MLSQQKGSVVLVKQATRETSTDARDSYIVAIFNPTSKPLNFSFSSLTVTQPVAGGQLQALKTYSYDELVAEEKRREVVSAILVGLSAGANAAAAANSGYYSASGTVVGPYGTSNVFVTGYSPAAAAAAQASASIQNQAMIDSAIETGRANLDSLGRSVIKDDTILPGEWYGGVVVFDQPTGHDPKAFQINVTVGTDVHQIDITQAPAPKS